MAADRATLEALRARVRKAEGSDAELDCLLWAEFDDRDAHWDGHKLIARSRRPPHDECWLGTIDPGRYQRNFQGTTGLRPPRPNYTASIDAAVALVERVLPGRNWSVEHHDVLLHETAAAIWRKDEASHFPGIQLHSAPTASLALLDALLSALLTEPSDA